MQLYLLSLYHTGSLRANWHLIILPIIVSLFYHALALDKAFNVPYSDTYIVQNELKQGRRSHEKTSLSPG